MTRTMLIALCAPMLLAPTCGGPNSFGSEEGQWRFEDTGLKAGLEDGLADGESLLPDERVCPRAPSWSGSTEELPAAAVLADCIEQGLEGSARFETFGERECIVMEGSGEVRWLLEPVDCALDLTQADGPLEADRVVFTVADPGAVSAGVLQWMELYALSDGSLRPEGVITEEDLLQPGDTLRVLAGQHLRIFVLLWDEEHQQIVAWRGAEGDVEVLESQGGYQADRDPYLGLSSSEGWIDLELESGARLDLGVQIRGQRFGGLLVEGVDGGDLASLELVVDYDDFAFEEEDGTVFEGDAPSIARAVVRDSEGRQVFGVPVDWRVSGGRLSVEPGASGQQGWLQGGDYARIGDACTHPRRLGGERRATLHASYGDLKGDLQMEWSWPEGLFDALYADDPEGMREYYREWEPDERCTGVGCTGCSSRAGGAGVWGWLGLLGLGLARRRRA